MLAAMDDLGSPTSYLALGRGTPVHDSRGERIGVLEHVLGDPDVDIFDGLIVDCAVGPGGLRFADADQVGRLFEHGVELTVGLDDLHDPEPAPGVLRADPADADESRLAERLRRAWDYISGRY